MISVKDSISGAISYGQENFSILGTGAVILLSLCGIMSKNDTIQKSAIMTLFFSWIFKLTPTMGK